MSSSFFPFSSSPRTPSAYITHLRSTQDSVWAVGSPRSLCCIDARSLSTRHSMELPSFPSTSTIQDMYASHSSSVAVVLSEGRWVQWDLRLAGGKAERAQLEWKVPGDRSALSLSSSAHQWAVGTDYKDEAAFIYLIDDRFVQPKESVFITESLGNDVTSLRYHPDYPHILLSTSTDGLCCVFDTTQLKMEAGEDAEDDALVSVLHADSSVAALGLFGDQSEYVWVRTDIETFSLWSLRQSTCLYAYGDIRAPIQGLDYLLDAVYFPHAQSLHLWGGSHSGSLFELQVQLGSLRVKECYQRGHGTTVRAMTTFGDTLWTGDEEGRVVVSQYEDVGR